MSHVYEALKRSSEGSHNRRPTDRFPLEQYPPESRTSSDPSKQPDRIAGNRGRVAEKEATPSEDRASAVPPPRTEEPVPVQAAPAAAGVEGKLVTGTGATHVSVEQYRRLAAVLHDTQIERGLKTLMVTSALPGEGKTLTVVNLALTLSEAYRRRVLVIDADLRWPSVHEFFGVSNERGLSEALRSEGGVVPLIEVSPRLSVLPSGHPDPHPLAGLTSERMRTLLDECAARFDWVLIDTAPVGFLPDAQLLSRLTRAVLFVIAAGSTPAAVVERAFAELDPESIVGTVLNRVEEATIPGVGYYGGSTRYKQIARLPEPSERPSSVYSGV